MKIKEIKDSTLKTSFFQTADILCPNGHLRSIDEPSKIPQENIEKLENQLQSVLDVMRKSHSMFHHKLTDFTERPLKLDVYPEIQLVDTGKGVAFAEPKGLITIDVKVLEDAFFSTLESLIGIADAYIYDSEDEIPKDRSKEQLFTTLTTFRNFIQSTPIGKSEQERGENVELYMRASHFSTSYSGVLLFILAHEVGHLARRHFEQEQYYIDGGEEVYSEWRKAIELEADKYALTLIMYTTQFTDPITSLFRNAFGAKELTGYYQFFINDYERMGFKSNSKSNKHFYPHPTIRWANLEISHKTLEKLIGKSQNMILEQRVFGEK